jgi:hypothetical protein
VIAAAIGLAINWDEIKLLLGRVINLILYIYLYYNSSIVRTVLSGNSSVVT